MARETTTQAHSVEEQLAAAQVRIAELEGSKKTATVVDAAPAPAAAPPAQSLALRADLAAGQATVAEWLAKGCPVCKTAIKTDTPVFQPTLPAFYPAILFHYGVFHEGTATPTAPHPSDEAALATPVIKGIMPNGTPRWIPYRQAIAEAVAEWKAGVR